MAIATRPGSPQFPAMLGSMPPSSEEAMDAAVRDVRAQKDAWTRVPVRERVRLVERLMRDFDAIGARWVAACLEAKSIPASAPAAGEEWATGPYTVIRHLRQTKEALAGIARSGRPRIPGPVTTLPNGQVAARVFPQNLYDAILFTGLTADVWMEPGVTRDELPKTQAVAYHEQQPGKVALVLGAGNVSNIGPLDVLYKLFTEDQVVVFKTNPVNAYLGPLIEEAFRALIEPGYLRVVYGGAHEGAYLCHHPDIEEIHITGSDKTFDAIVFGTGPEGAARKAAGTPLLSKRVTGELGNVSPVIVVPGPWSASDLRYHGAHIASMLTNNAGFNCNATRVIVQHADWKQRDDLLRHTREVLAAAPPRQAYYPGAVDRHASFVAAHPEAEQIGSPGTGALPWTLVTGVDPAREDDICFTTEAFCSLFAETALEAGSVAEYIDQAVAFCNDQLWGTLNATILVHPGSLKDAAVKAALERAVANLRYGTVGVNYWAGASFVLGTTTWGAFPGHALTDIQSGTGVVHNTLMFARPQKTVLRSPFRVTPTPPWFVNRGSAGRKVFRKLAKLEKSPSPLKVPSIVASAVGG